MREGRVLLQDVDLHLDRGEIVAVLGPNGVGKSTLLSVLAGLLPTAAGAVRREGRVATALQSPALARRTVRRNIELASQWWGVPRADRRARADAALARLNATHLADRLAVELSGGEARRVHLARALALQPDALLLDEPFAGLDPPTRAELLRDASSALRHPERGALIVLHDRAEAWALADRLVVLLDGGVAAAGPPAAVLEQPPSLAVADFLGFTGRLSDGHGGVRALRPANVSIDAAGAVSGTVRTRIPEEDGVLCEVDVGGQRLQLRTGHPGPAEGEIVSLSIHGGVSFPEAAHRL